MSGHGARPLQLAPGQSVRRLERVERHGVRARQPQGLRRLGGSRKSWLELQGCAALLHQVRGQPEPLLVPNERVPRPGRLPDRVRSALAHAASRRVHNGGRGTGLREPRHQRPQSERVHDHADHFTEGQSVQHGQSVPQTGSAQTQHSRVTAQPGDQGSIRPYWRRRAPSRGRRVPEGRQAAHGGRTQGSNSVGGRDRFATVAHGVRRRAGRPPQGNGHQGRQRPKSGLQFTRPRRPRRAHVYH